MALVAIRRAGRSTRSHSSESAGLLRLRYSIARGRTTEQRRRSEAQQSDQNQGHRQQTNDRQNSEDRCAEPDEQDAARIGETKAILAPHLPDRNPGKCP
jgi:hypothetical protein